MKKFDELINKKMKLYNEAITPDPRAKKNPIAQNAQQNQNPTPDTGTGMGQTPQAQPNLTGGNPTNPTNAQPQAQPQGQQPQAQGQQTQPQAQQKSATIPLNTALDAIISAFQSKNPEAMKLMNDPKYANFFKSQQG